MGDFNLLIGKDKLISYSKSLSSLFRGHFLRGLNFLHGLKIRTILIVIDVFLLIFNFIIVCKRFWLMG